MIGFNIQRVINAPVTIVLLADKYGRYVSIWTQDKPVYIQICTLIYAYIYMYMNSANTRKLMELEKKNNGHPMYIDALPAMVSFAQVSVHVQVYVY